MYGSCRITTWKACSPDDRPHADPFVFLLKTSVQNRREYRIGGIRRCDCLLQQWPGWKSSLQSDLKNLSLLLSIESWRTSNKIIEEEILEILEIKKMELNKFKTCARFDLTNFKFSRNCTIHEIQYPIRTKSEPRVEIPVSDFVAIYSRDDQIDVEISTRIVYLLNRFWK